MGILNVTPDSFSDGGKYLDLGAAVAHAEKMLAEGADFIDVGGESTRPGADPVPESEELRRVVPVVEAIVKRLSARVSVDTYKSAVAKAAVEAGAAVINDVTGLRGDPRMAEVAPSWACRSSCNIRAARRTCSKTQGTCRSSRRCCKG